MLLLQHVRGARPTPDGTADWNKWTLATLSYSGGTGSLSCTQYEIAAHWHAGKRQQLP